MINQIEAEKPGKNNQENGGIWGSEYKLFFYDKI